MITSPLRHARRCGAVILLGAGLAGLGASPGFAAAAPSQGYVRLAHLSPDTPAVDVYLYAAGKKTPRLVLRHVGYGALSPYQRLGTGSYTVAMRPADAAATSKPVLSTKVNVANGEAYTVAGMGPYKGIQLKVLDDSVRLPSGRAGLRVIAASLKESTLKVNCGGRTFTDDLKFGSASAYWTMPAKATSVKIKGRSGPAATTKVKLTPGSVHTVIALDGASGLKLLDLRDSSRGARTPTGGVDTGLGGLSAGGSGWSGAFWTVCGISVLTLLGLGMLLRRRT